MTKIDTNGFETVHCTGLKGQQRFLFLLLPGYSPMDVSIAIESLCEANAGGATPAYTWRVHSESGQPVESRSGLALAVDGGLEGVEKGTTIILCGGNRLEGDVSSELLHWLRKAARHGITLAALGSGCAVLMQAGLLNNKSIAAHWAISDALKETYPNADISQSVYEIHDTFLTCAGGLATADFFLALLADHHGVECAQDAAALMNCSNIRDSRGEQTFSAACRLGRQSEPLVAAVELMNDNIEAPLSPFEIAEKVGVSCRQLERLFSKHLGISPKRYNDNMRLEHARKLLQQTQMSIMEVALASGFNSVNHFGKVYRSRYSVSPIAERGIPCREPV